MKTTKEELFTRLDELEGQRGILECRAIEGCLELWREVERLAADLTLAKQSAADALHELRNAVGVIESYANGKNWGYDNEKTRNLNVYLHGHGPQAARHFLSQRKKHPDMENAPEGADYDVYIKDTTR